MDRNQEGLLLSGPLLLHNLAWLDYRLSLGLVGHPISMWTFRKIY
jgi:hypothetical protein